MAVPCHLARLAARILSCKYISMRKEWYLRGWNLRAVEKSGEQLDKPADCCSKVAVTMDVWSGRDQCLTSAGGAAGPFTCSLRWSRRAVGVRCGVAVSACSAEPWAHNRESSEIGHHTSLHVLNKKKRLLAGWLSGVSDRVEQE